MENIKIMVKEKINSFKAIRNKGRFVKIINSDFQFKKGHIPLNKRNDLDENEIISLYKNNNLREIAKILNCGHSTVHNILNKNNINTSLKGRTHTEENIRKGIQTRIKNGSYGEKFKKRISVTKQGITLEQWKNFKSFEPYTIEFNLKFKNFIRHRDNQICMNCGIHREKLSKSLDIHHINYDKKLSIPENCISLCHPCHSSTHINRPYWTKLFQEKLSKLYGYKYLEDGYIELNFETIEVNNNGK